MLRGLGAAHPAEPVERGEPPSQEPGAQQTGGARTATVNLPFVTAQFRAPQLHVPHVSAPRVRRDEMTAAANTARSFLPPRKQALYYAGLAALAATEVVEWPVAAAIAVGVAIARPEGEAGHEERRAQEPSGRGEA